jgi:hypothetical protein
MKRRAIDYLKKNKAPIFYFIDLLDMVAETPEERKVIITNFLLYMDTKLSQRTDIKYDGWVRKLKPTIFTLYMLYPFMKQFDFLEAWTFALSTFNYSKAIKEFIDKQRKTDTHYIR